MPRKARIDAPSSLHHLIVRGIEGNKIFENDADRNTSVRRLGQASIDTRTDCFVWTLLPNHVHLVMRSGGRGLIRSLGGWSAIKALRRMSERIKGDECIPGDGSFVEEVLKVCQERLERRYRYQSMG